MNTYKGHPPTSKYCINILTIVNSIRIRPNS